MRASACLLACSLALASLATVSQESPQQPAGSEPNELEPVTAAPPVDGGTPSAAFMEQVYAAARTGKGLYDEGKYAESLPHLLAASQYGFKLAQAALADIYLHGRGGVPRNTAVGIGWMGAAAEPPTSTRIAEYYDKVLAQLAPEQTEAARSLVVQYRARFASSEHGVACRRFGNVVEDLRCVFLDDPDFAEQANEPPEYLTDGYVEEMVVTAPIVRTPAPEPGEVPSGQFIAEVYDAANRGSQLYREKRYKEALPYLVAAAKRGFKWAQASAADIYLHGLGGVPVDLESGIGWLGVAAQPKTNNAILKFFNESKSLMPERYTEAAIDTIVSDYRAQYGHRAHRVACRLDTDEGVTWSFNFKRLRCHFIDEATQCRNISIGEEEIQSEWTCQPLTGTRTLDARPY